MALTDNIVAYWKTDEVSGNRADSTASALTLTDVNTVASASGIIALGADFTSASSEYLKNTDAGNIIPSAAPFTISYWIKGESASGVRSQFSKGKGSNEGWSVYLDTGVYNWVKWGVAAAGTGVSNSAGAFEFVVWTYDTDKKFRLYINGTLVHTASDTSTIAPTATFTEFQLGADLQGTGSYADFADGILDEIGVWTRVLTGGEITSLYNGGAGLTYPFGGATVNSNFFTLMR